MPLAGTQRAHRCSPPRRSTPRPAPRRAVFSTARASGAQRDRREAPPAVCSRAACAHRPTPLAARPPPRRVVRLADRTHLSFRNAAAPRNATPAARLREAQPSEESAQVCPTRRTPLSHAALHARGSANLAARPRAPSAAPMCAPTVRRSSRSRPHHPAPPPQRAPPTRTPAVRAKTLLLRLITASLTCVTRLCASPASSRSAAAAAPPSTCCRPPPPSPLSLLKGRSSSTPCWRNTSISLTLLAPCATTACLLTRRPRRCWTCWTARLTAAASCYTAPTPACCTRSATPCSTFKACRSSACSAPLRCCLPLHRALALTSPSRRTLLLAGRALHPQAPARSCTWRAPLRSPHAALTMLLTLLASVTSAPGSSARWRCAATACWTLTRRCRGLRASSSTGRTAWCAAHPAAHSPPHSLPVRDAPRVPDPHSAPSRAALRTSSSAWRSPPPRARGLPPLWLRRVLAGGALGAHDAQCRRAHARRARARRRGRHGGARDASPWCARRAAPRAHRRKLIALAHRLIYPQACRCLCVTRERGMADASFKCALASCVPAPLLPPSASCPTVRFLRASLAQRLHRRVIHSALASWRRSGAAGRATELGRTCPSPCAALTWLRKPDPRRPHEAPEGSLVRAERGGKVRLHAATFALRGACAAHGRRAPGRTPSCALAVVAKVCPPAHALGVEAFGAPCRRPWLRRPMRTRQKRPPRRLSASEVRAVGTGA